LHETLSARFTSFEDYKAFADQNQLSIVDNTCWKTNRERLDGQFQYQLSIADRFPNKHTRLCRALGIPTLDEVGVLAAQQSAGAADESNAIACEANSIARKSNDLARKANVRATFANILSAVALLASIVAILLEARRR